MTKSVALVTDLNPTSTTHKPCDQGRLFNSYVPKFHHLACQIRTMQIFASEL